MQVVANAVTALTDIHIAATAAHASALEGGGDASDDIQRATFTITSQILAKLLIALNECTEWGRVAILSSLARYGVRDEKESEHICERVVPQFQHANGSVVLAAVKVGFCYFVFCLGSQSKPGHYDSSTLRDKTGSR